MSSSIGVSLNESKENVKNSSKSLERNTNLFVPNNITFDNKIQLTKVTVNKKGVLIFSPNANMYPVTCNLYQSLDRL